MVSQQVKVDQEVESDSVADVFAEVHGEMLAKLQLRLDAAGLVNTANRSHGSNRVERLQAPSRGG